jgi:hypothetical protein
MLLLPWIVLDLVVTSMAWNTLAGLAAFYNLGIVLFHKGIVEGNVVRNLSRPASPVTTTGLL